MSELARVRRLTAGAGLLDELRAALVKYVVLPSEQATDAVVLWIAATHVQPAWEHATRLGIVAPEKRCGKTRLLDVVEATCNEPLVAVNATTAAIYRSISDDEPPTLLFDEVDAIFGSKRAAEDNEDLRALLNAGHGRGKPVLRCHGPNQEVKAFPSFAMAALAGIGELPDTVADRAVVVKMRRRAPGETVRPFRVRRDVPALNDLRDRIHDWLRQNLDHLADAEPELPVEDRAADTWESLVAVADLAGGHWPKRARRAAMAFVAQAEEADADASLSTRLLADIRHIFEEFTVSFLPSTELLTRLHKIEESPWQDFNLTTRGLADRLKKYDVNPGHNTAKTARGYRLEDFTDVFARYLPPTSGGNTSETVRPSEQDSDQQVLPDGSRTPDASNRPAVLNRPAVSAGHSGSTDARTVSDAPPTKNDQICPEPGCGWPIGSAGCPHEEPGDAA